MTGNFNSFCILFLLLTLFSCTSKKEKQKDSSVFRYNEHSNISSLDPAFAKNLANIWATNQLFNGLVQLDDSLHVQPDIAKSWDISEDGLEYNFTIRKDVFFHKSSLFEKDSTRNVVASDFTYSFDRLTSKKVASPGRWVMQNVASYKALNDSIFSIKLKAPFPPFLGLLSMKYCSVVPKEIVEHKDFSFREQPIGTGPFHFKLWVENTKLVFRKNPNYHEKNKKGEQLPHLEAIAITFLPDKQSEFLQFIQGNIDFLSGIAPSYKDELLTESGTLQKTYSAAINIEKSPFLNTEYLGIYLDVPKEIATHSLWIRKAINFGFDRKKMLKYLRNNIGIPATSGIIPKGLPAYQDKNYVSYDPEKASQFISEYKKRTGIEEPKITITTNSQYLDLCEFIQRELQKIGLDVAIDVIPPSALRQGKANGKLEIFRASWVADYPDSENYLSLFFSKNFAPNGPNYTHYKNEKFDQLYLEAISTIENKKRYLLYQKMDSLLMLDAPIIPLYYYEVIRFSQKDVTGLGINPINLLVLKNVRKY